jgi:hypothetical protein
VKSGGLGLRATSPHLVAAFIAGVNAAARLDGWDASGDGDYEAASASFATRFPAVALSPLLTQKELSTAVEQAAWASLLASSPDRYDLGGLRSVSKLDAGAAWNVIPSQALHLALPPQHFRVIARWWLGDPIYERVHPCPLCAAPCDVRGYHSLTCRNGGNLGVRHNALRNVVLSAARFAGLAPRAEQRVLPGSFARPADLLLPGTHGRVCDFAVTHPLQSSYLSGTAAGTSSAAEAYALAHKTAKYGADVEAHGYEFSPCVVDTYGNWCAAGREVLEEVAEASSASDGRPTRLHLRLLNQRCASILMLSNARALLQRADPALLFDDAVPEDAVTGALDDDASPAINDSTINVAGDPVARDVEVASH